MMSVRLSVTEVHWRIIANLRFKFRSHFTAHCGGRARPLAVLLAGRSSRAMLASARALVFRPMCPVAFTVGLPKISSVDQTSDWGRAPPLRTAPGPDCP